MVSSRQATLAPFCKAHARHLDRIDDAGFAQIAVVAVSGVVAVVLFLAPANVVDDDGAIEAGVLRDQPARHVEHVGQARWTPSASSPSS